MKNILIPFCFFCLLLFSCKTPQQKINDLHRKYPELFAKDTIRVVDSFYLPTVNADTIFRQSAIKDTVIVNNDRLQMKYFYNNDTVFLSGTCKDTTIIKEVKVVTDKANITQADSSPWYKDWRSIALMAVVLALLLVVWIRR